MMTRRKKLSKLEPGTTASKPDVQCLGRRLKVGLSKLIISIGLLCSLATILSAQTIWTGGGDGMTFSDGDNWDNGVPSSGVTAIFDETGQLTVEFTENAFSGQIRVFGTADAGPPVSPNTVIFELGGFDYVSDGGNNTLLIVPRPDTRTFAVRNGTLTFQNTQFLGHDRLSSLAQNGTSSLRVQENAEVIMSSTLNMGWQRRLNNNTTVNLFVEEGGLLTVDASLNVGAGGDNSQDMTVNLIVTGTGSAVNQTTSRTEIAPASNGTTATLQVLAGASFTAQRVDMAPVAVGDATLTVDGAGSSFTTINLYVGGDNSSAAGMALAGFSNGGVGDVQNNLRVYRNSADDTYGTLSVASADFTGVRDATVEVGGTTAFDIDSVFNLTLNSIHDSLALKTGSLSLDDTILTVALGTGFSASENDVYQMIQFDSFTIGDGHFQGLPDGAAFWVGNVPFQINYDTPDPGNDTFVFLTVIPEPGTIGLIIGCLLAWGLRRRRRPLS